MVKISVIIPVYNVDTELMNRCVNSLLNQTFKDFEIIIIDDGSDIVYSSIFSDLELRDNKIRVFHQKNSGVSYARNIGTQLANGQYMCYVDADDMVTSSFLEEAYHIAVKEQADIVIGGNGYSDKMYVEQPQDNLIVDKYIGDEIRLLYKYMMGNQLMELGDDVFLGQGPWTRLIRASLAKKISFDISLKIGEDIVWNYKLLEQSNKVCIVHKLWYLYYINPYSASRKFRSDAIEQSRKSLNEIVKYVNLENDEEYRAYCSRCISDLKRIYYTYYSTKENSKVVSPRALYEYPWKEASSKKYYNLCSKKEKIIYLLYKFHCLFVFYKLKDLFRRY